jgi:hypothetical protein
MERIKLVYNCIEKTKTIGSRKNVRTTQHWPMPWALTDFATKT